ncbi:MAG: helix-turn-helix transcriptional regulator [Hespellia sp.]|nr:helix-turn-helix transcriptional regulator [Hespellia sp.]
MLDKKEIGKELVRLRGKKTQDEVANAVGISVSALSMYECGERIPRDPIKIALARFFNKSVEAIFFTERTPRKVTDKAKEVV